MGGGILSKNMSLMLVLLLVLWLMLDVQVTIASRLPRFRQSTKDDGSLSFLVVGDCGRKGAFNQSLIAAQMGTVGNELDVDFVVSTGDNFYDDGLTGVNDTAFAVSFTDIYTSSSLQKQWYSVLGNHDYRGDALAQMDPVLKKLDSRWFCLRSYIVNAEIVDFFFVDTSPFVDKYFTDDKHTYDWRGVLPRQKYLSNLLKDVDQALKLSTAKWKFVIGHHTIMSAGFHGNTTELVNQLLPILESTPIFNKWRRIKGMERGIKPWNPEELKLYYDGQGFMSAKLPKLKLMLHSMMFLATNYINGTQPSPVTSPETPFLFVTLKLLISPN